MHCILAEDIGPWLLAAGALFGGLGLSVLALGALLPAWKGHRLLTLALAVPAFLLGIVVTLWLGFGSLAEIHDPDFEFGHDLFLPWLFMAGPSLVTSVLAVTVLCIRRNRMTC